MRIKWGPAPTDPLSFVVTGFFIGHGLGALLPPRYPVFGVIPKPAYGLFFLSANASPIMIIVPFRAMYTK